MNKRFSSRLGLGGAILLSAIFMGSSTEVGRIEIPRWTVPHHGRVERSTVVPDSVYVSSIYNYRLFALQYDSLHPLCAYGEICLPSEDSLQISFLQDFGSSGVDTTADKIPGMTRTETFQADPSTTLSMFRLLAYQVATRSVPPFFPDTCDWVLQLRRESDNALLATLDSLGFLAQQVPDTSHFAVYFGTLGTPTGSYEILEYNLGDYIDQGAQSVYLEWHVCAHGDPGASWNVSDSKVVNQKYSAMMMGGGSGSPAAVKTTGNRAVQSYELGIFPNPVNSMSRLQLRLPETKDINIRLYAADGSLIATLYAGRKNAGLNVLGVRWPQLNPGAYFVAAEDGSGTRLTTGKFVKQ